MILLPPINLFFYNIVLGFMDCQYKRTMDGTLSESALSFWHKVPVISSFMDNPEPLFPDPYDILPELNPYINALILLPAIFKHKYFKVLLALVLMWNIVICKRILIYFVRLLATLWYGGFSWTYFLTIFVFAFIMNFAHLLLMYYTAKLPVGQALNWHNRNR